MWHPWRHLRDEYAEWLLYLTPLPAGIDGCTDSTRRLIWISNELDQVQRRCALTHELVHAERGDDGPCDDHVEALIDAEAARRLIDIHKLAAAVVWARDLYELAAELWVTPEMVLTRRDHLHPSERRLIEEALERRDGICRTPSTRSQHAH